MIRILREVARARVAIYLTEHSPFANARSEPGWITNVGIVW
jgi:hypothetical protein